MKVLVVIDYQGDFVDGVLAIEGAIDLQKKIQREIDSDVYDKVFYTFDTHIEEDYKESEESKEFPMHCAFKTEGWRPRIKSRNRFYPTKPFDFIGIDNEFFFCKDKFDIFEGNKVYEDVINNLEDAEFYLTGVATNYCVYTHAMGLIKRGFKVCILKECVKGIEADPLYDAKIKEMEDAGVKFKNNNYLSETFLVKNTENFKKNLKGLK